MFKKLIEEIMANFSNNEHIDTVKKCKIFNVEPELLINAPFPFLLQIPLNNKYQFEFNQDVGRAYNFISLNGNNDLNLIPSKGLFDIQDVYRYVIGKAPKLKKHFTLFFKKENEKIKITLSELDITKINTFFTLGLDDKISNFEIEITDNPKEMSDLIYRKIIYTLNFLCSIELLMGNSEHIIRNSLEREIEQEIVVI